MNRENFIESVSSCETLHILADFDKTLTMGREGQASLVSLLRGSLSSLSEEYKTKANELKAKYSGYENDPRLDYDERSKKMMEWWIEHYRLMIEQGLSEEVVNECVDRCELRFREGFEEMNDLCKEFGIPLVIMSASKTNMIERFLIKNGFWHDGIHIVSNRLIFNEDGLMIDHSKPVIHSLNKKEIMIDGDLLGVIGSRRNVILLGDSLGDASMIDGFKYQSLWKVAFERSKGDEIKLQAYRDNFDTVLGFGESLDLVVDTLKQICDVEI